MVKKKKYCRKILSLLFALCMSVALCQVTALAFVFDFSRYEPNGDYYMVNFNVIGIPQNPVPDNFSDCTIGGEIEYSYGVGGMGCISSPRYDLGTEVGGYHFPTDEQTGIAELTVFPDPGVKITGIAQVINGGAPLIYGNISIEEIPTNVYSGSAVTGDLPGIEDDGSYTLYFNIPTTDALSTTDDSYFAVKYEAASPDEIPDAPTNLKWTRDEANSAWVLSWDTVADAEKYRYNVIINYFNYDISLIAGITDINKLVLSDSEFEMYNVPCDLKIKVSSIKNTVRSEEVNAPIHNMVMEKDDTVHWNECSACHYIDAMSRVGHSYGEWIIDTPATETTSGEKHRECACGYVQNAEIDPTPPTTPVRPTYPTTPTTPTTSTKNIFNDKLVVEVETDGNTATLSWENIDGADKYIIYQYKNEEWVKIKTTTELSATFKKLKNGKDYKFLVRYIKDGKLSPERYSCECTVNAYYKPIVKATSTESSVRLIWKEVPGAEKYAVYKYVNGKAVKLAETEKLAVRIQKLQPDTEYSYIVRAYVDGEWTTMQKSDIVTVNTKAE